VSPIKILDPSKKNQNFSLQVDFGIKMGKNYP
jgi:hypothetical protein